jgi:hypothetical protein
LLRALEHSFVGWMWGSSYLIDRHSHTTKTLSRHAPPAVDRDGVLSLLHHSREVDGGELRALRRERCSKLLNISGHIRKPVSYMETALSSTKTALK